jgi:hypothetical protein
MSKTLVCVFNGHPISFFVDKENNMMVNATEMAKIFGKQVFDFTRNKGTIKFIRLLENKLSQNGMCLKVVCGRQRSGTWMHRILALKFAKWLDPSFELWLCLKVDKLISENNAKKEQSFNRSLQLKDEMEALVSKKNKTGADFDRYLAIENELRKEKQKRRALTTGTVSDTQTEMDFSDEI